MPAGRRFAFIPLLCAGCALLPAAAWAFTSDAWPLPEPVVLHGPAQQVDHGFGPVAMDDTTGVPSDPSIDADLAMDTTSVLDATNQFPQEHHRKRWEDLKPGHDFVFGMKTLGSDAWAVAKGPTTMDRSDFLWTIGVFGVAGALYYYDLDVLNGMHRSWDAPIYGPIVKFGSKYEKLGYIGALAPYYAGGFALTYMLRLDPFPQMFAEAAESNLITGVVRNVLEMTLRRQRPREGYDPRAWFVKGGDSFPSGHASVVFELATIASQHTRSNWLRVVYYAVAGSVSVARAQDDAHWPSDVFMGAVIGTVVSRAIVRRH